MSNSSKSLDATTSARAARGGCFKRCCMKSGRYDGSERSHYRREDRAWPAALLIAAGRHPPDCAPVQKVAASSWLRERRRFDLVAFGIADEGGVVTAEVRRTRPRCAARRATLLHCGGMKRLHRLDARR